MKNTVFSVPLAGLGLEQQNRVESHCFVIILLSCFSKFKICRYSGEYLRQPGLHHPGLR